MKPAPYVATGPSCSLFQTLRRPAREGGAPLCVEAARSAEPAVLVAAVLA
ncbi:hypothetical protein [Streptomyces sp. V2I9]|nr:hypothetical protein [Streptomyces sp. V2I9]MDQ0988287.1 hypothetical protein [Streptomyces sp. V2I9]